MIKIATALNSFASAPEAAVPPSEEIFVLTAGQLQDLILKTIQQATAPLKVRIQNLEQERKREESGEGKGAIQALKTRLESLEEMTARERAFDRQRISRLEHPEKEPGKKELTRAAKIEKYLAARPDHRATFETLKGHLGVTNDLLGDAIKTLMEASPGRYTVLKAQQDKRKRILVMLPK
jgi:hypothetical protein